MHIFDKCSRYGQPLLYQSLDHPRHEARGPFDAGHAPDRGVARFSWWYYSFLEAGDHCRTG